MNFIVGVLVYLLPEEVMRLFPVRPCTCLYTDIHILWHVSATFHECLFAVSVSISASVCVCVPMTVSIAESVSASVACYVFL